MKRIGISLWVVNSEFINNWVFLDNVSIKLYILEKAKETWHFQFYNPVYRVQCLVIYTKDYYKKHWLVLYSNKYEQYD